MPNITTNHAITYTNAIDRDLFYGPKFGDDLVIYLDPAYVQDSKAVLVCSTLFQLQ